MDYICKNEIMFILKCKESTHFGCCVCVGLLLVMDHLIYFNVYKLYVLTYLYSFLVVLTTEMEEDCVCECDNKCVMFVYM